MVKRSENFKFKFKEGKKKVAPDLMPADGQSNNCGYLSHFGSRETKIKPVFFSFLFFLFANTFRHSKNLILFGFLIEYASGEDTQLG